jgi:hypothetical protein
MGGLGNQMFQIAHTISEGLKYNVPCVFRSYSFTPMQGNDTSKYVNNIFKKLNFDNNPQIKNTISESDFSYSPVIFDPSFSTEFYGYFQSSKYFNGFEEYIKNLFGPSDETVKILKEKYPQINYENTLSIHVRRGDCLLHSHIHPVISEKYLKKSFNRIDSVSHVFVFSDDKEWVEKNLNYENITFVNDEDYEEIWLMSLCQNNIISNSTFSWWGSFLNRHNNKKVIAPSIWFGPNGPKNFKDVYEKNWDVVDVTYENGWLV